MAASSIRPTLILALGVAFFALANGSGAETPLDPGPPTGLPVHYDAPVQKRIDYLTAKLSLSASQTAQVGQILNQAWRSLGQTFILPEMSQDVKRAKEIRARAKEKISLILTPEQREAYSHIKSQGGLP